MKTVLEQLIEEIREEPEGSLELFDVFSKVLQPWEEETLTAENSNLPRGNAIKALKRKTLFGKDYAVIFQNYPSWKIMIDGKKPKGAPNIFNKRGAETQAVEFVDEQLEAAGMILVKPRTLECSD